MSQITSSACPPTSSPLLVAVRRLPRRLDPRRGVRLLPRPVRRHLAVPDARRHARSCFTAVGYGAGRIRELRDPAHGLAPVAVGAAATAIAAIGFALLQFLLGVDAPVSLLLLRQILMTIVLNTLLALPVYALMRRVLLPFLPDDPRRRRRRAYTTGGLSPISRA